MIRWFDVLLEFQRFLCIPAAIKSVKRHKPNNEVRTITFTFHKGCEFRYKALTTHMLPKTTAIQD